MKNYPAGDVVLSASSRFYGDVKGIKSDLESKGFIVYAPNFEFDETKVQVEEDEKHRLTHDFLKKIKASESLYIINPGGYVGMSVAVEAGYASALGKNIYALEKPSEPAVAALVLALKLPEELRK